MNIEELKEIVASFKDYADGTGKYAHDLASLLLKVSGSVPKKWEHSYGCIYDTNHFDCECGALFFNQCHDDMTAWLSAKLLGLPEVVGKANLHYNNNPTETSYKDFIVQSIQDHFTKEKG